jgi:hypothetical protein
MDISALVHRHAEAVVIPACRIRHIYLLCFAVFALMTFLFPRQLGAMDDSDEELQLIADVALLDSRLKKAGCPFDETMHSHRFLNFNEQPLANRLKLWSFRKQLREKLVAEMLSPSPASGETAAAALTVIKQEIKQETEKKRKIEETAYVHEFISKSKPNFRYI